MARSFNGTSDIIHADAAHSFATSSGSLFSVAAWVNASAALGQQNVYGEGSNGSNNNNLLVSKDNTTTGGHLEVIVHTTANVLDHITTATPFDGTPHHVLWTWNAPNSTIYVDGVQDSTKTAGASNFTTNNLTIGGLHRTSDGRFYAGKVWDVATWTRQLSAGEAWLLASGLPASHLYPSHYWPLWGVGSPEPDIGGATHTAGTLTGTTAANGARVSRNLLLTSRT